MKEADLLKWFTEDLLTELLKNGTFSDKGEAVSLKNCKFEAIGRGESNFASLPYFAEVTVDTLTGPVTHEIIIKFQCQDPTYREKFKLILQFQNEVTMFTEVLPAFAEFLNLCGGNERLIQEVVPKCYFAKHEVPEKSILILEDLRKYGYKLSTSVTDLDLEHCLVAFERLAEFHAISFAMKFRKWDPFEKLKKSFVEVWFENNELTRNQCEEFLGHCATRGIDYLLSEGNSEVPSDYLEKFKKLIQPAGLFDLLRGLRSPREPLSVICHGDFNRNNTLYRYDNGKLVDAKLIDFQTYHYGSPCLDLSFFIYMNTTLEFREKYFDDVFRHYHSSLIRRISLILKESEESVASTLPIEAFREEFARVAVMGYVIVAFFLPLMMFPMKDNLEENIKEKSVSESAMENYALGGKVASKRIADVIVDFYRRKFYM